MRWLTAGAWKWVNPESGTKVTSNSLLLHKYYTAGPRPLLI